VPATPTRSGYDFSYWQGVWTNVTSNQTVQAIFTKVQESTGGGTTTTPNITVNPPAVTVQPPNVIVNEEVRPSTSVTAPPATVVVNEAADNASASAGNGGAGLLEEPETIEEEEVPLAVVKQWHLLDVILTIIAVILGMILLGRGLRRRDEEEEAYDIEINDKIHNTRRAYGFTGTGLGLGSLFLLLLTQGFGNGMSSILADVWAIVMIVIIAMQIIIMFSLPAFRKHEEEDDMTSEDASGYIITPSVGGQRTA
jgi:uncharacterized membrane protein